MKVTKEELLKRRIRREAVEKGRKTNASFEDILRAVRHILGTTEGADVIDRAESVMNQLTTLRSIVKRKK